MSSAARSTSGRSVRAVGAAKGFDPEEEADPTVEVENPSGDLTLDFSEKGKVQVTGGHRTLKKASGETVFDFSDPAQPDLLTGEPDPGVEESKGPVGDEKDHPDYLGE